MIPRLEEVQGAIISKLKASTVPAMLVDSQGVVHTDEIREVEWRGTKFYYPCIRVRVTPLTPKTVSSSCTEVSCDASVLIIGEDYSSLKINQIASEVLQIFHGYAGTINSVRMSGVGCVQHAADFKEEGGVWVAEVKMSLNSVTKLSS